MTPLLVPTGDPAGVGPIVAVRAAARWCARERIVLFGDGARLAALCAREGVRTIDGGDASDVGVSIVDSGSVSDAAIEARAPTEEGGRAQLAALDLAIDRALRGEGRAIVTAPVSKAAVERGGTKFVGQTEHLAERAGLARDAVTMMFLGPHLKVALATTHLALRDVPSAITDARVERTIVHLAEALARLSDRRPLRIAVSGLNPHAGEEGMFGSEEIERIAPAIERARGYVEVELEGPIGAETALRRGASGGFDGVVAMFHDQATIASKLVDWTLAVNVTWGLPFVRTSVDHGVAYDAAANGTADAAGMEAALELAVLLTESAR